MNIGDVVYLKSGSPAMTIVEISPNPPHDVARCAYYTENGFQKAEFNFKALTCCQEKQPSKKRISNAIHFNRDSLNPYPLCNLPNIDAKFLTFRQNEVTCSNCLRAWRRKFA